MSCPLSELGRRGDGDGEARRLTLLSPNYNDLSPDLVSALSRVVCAVVPCFPGFREFSVFITPRAPAPAPGSCIATFTSDQTRIARELTEARTLTCQLYECEL